MTNLEAWGTFKVTPEGRIKALPFCRLYLSNLKKYQYIEAQTGVPSWVVAGLHMRESGMDFDCNLMNGEPINRVTRLVPKGRGPWSSWERSAVDALEFDSLAHRLPTFWSIDNVLDIVEKYNGLGYRKRNVPSPYLWAGTTKYSIGKYTADGVYNPAAIDKQAGFCCFAGVLHDEFGVELWNHLGARPPEAPSKEQEPVKVEPKPVEPPQTKVEPKLSLWGRLKRLFGR